MTEEKKSSTKLTSCCGAYSTYDQDGYLYCKKCFNTVPVGEGDGNVGHAFGEQDWSWILADGEDIWDALAPYENLAQDWDDDDER